RPNFFHVVLESPESRDATIINWLAAAEDASPSGSRNATIGDQAPGHDTSAQLEYLFDLGVTNDGFPLLRIEHSGHRFFYLIQQFINDAVELDLNAFPFRCRHRHALDFDIEADHDRVRSAGEKDV